MSSGSSSTQEDGIAINAGFIKQVYDKIDESSGNWKANWV